MFPIINNSSFYNVFNAISINYNSKNLTFFIKYSKNNFLIINFFKKINLISSFLIIKKKKKFFFFIKLLYFKIFKIIKNFKCFSKPSRFFFVSLKALKLIKKKTGSSLYLVSSSQGSLTHDEAIIKKTGGFLIGVFFN